MRPILLLLFLLAGHGCRQPDDLVVGGAASLSAVLPELVEGFRAAHPDIAVTTTLGSSGQLAAQIRQGAPIDIFLSADAAWVDTLVAAGRVAAETRAVYARGRLVLWSRDPDAPYEGIADLASLEGRVAIANPAFAPYGRAAVQALRAAGVHDAVEPRLAIAENVRQALQYAETGNAVVAFVALALVPDAGRTVTVDAALHDPLDQALGVVTGDREAAARALAAWVLGPDGRAILARHGFDTDRP